MLDCSDRALERLAAAARREASLEFLLLFGSRARGDSHLRSDWDLGFLAAGPGFDMAGFLAKAVLLLGSDRVDLVDLAHASGLLRFRAAGEGRVLIAEKTAAIEQHLARVTECLPKDPLPAPRDPSHHGRSSPWTRHRWFSSRRPLTTTAPSSAWRSAMTAQASRT